MKYAEDLSQFYDSIVLRQLNSDEQPDLNEGDAAEGDQKLEDEAKKSDAQAEQKDDGAEQAEEDKEQK